MQWLFRRERISYNPVGSKINEPMLGVLSSGKAASDPSATLIDILGYFDIFSSSTLQRRAS